jgi:pimeloyl-ACP methyl ester carboxylesterase
MMRGLFLALLLMIIPLTLRADTATEIETAGPSGPLRGTFLSTGSTGHPAVLIIPGSGPTDRDGNNPRAVRASTYRLLAEGHAARGVSSIRIDKRGMFGSAAAVPDPNAVTIRDYADDVRRWSATLREHTGAPCVWLLGHSEGGLVALAAAKDAPDVCGLILVAAPGRPLGEILREQLRANPANAPILGEAEHAIDRLEAGKPVDAATLHPALLPLFRPEAQGFLIDALSYDPAAMFAGIAKPVLILQGGRDLQVSVTDAERLKAAKPEAELRIVPDANHVLKTVESDDRAANIATYSAVGLPLAPDIIPAITRFMTAHAPGR